MDENAMILQVPAASTTNTQPATAASLGQLGGEDFVAALESLTVASKATTAEILADGSVDDDASTLSLLSEDNEIEVGDEGEATSQDGEFESETTLESTSEVAPKANLDPARVEFGRKDVERNHFLQEAVLLTGSGSGSDDVQLERSLSGDHLEEPLVGIHLAGSELQKSAYPLVHAIEPQMIDGPIETALRQSTGGLGNTAQSGAFLPEETQSRSKMETAQIPSDLKLDAVQNAPNHIQQKISEIAGISQTQALLQVTKLSENAGSKVKLETPAITSDVQSAGMLNVARDTYNFSKNPTLLSAVFSAGLLTPMAQSVNALPDFVDKGGESLEGLDLPDLRLQATTELDRRGQTLVQFSAGSASADQARQIANQLSAAVSKGTDGTTEVRLNPEELGRVRLTLSGNEASMVVAITIERPETQELMRKHMDQLAQEFRSMGFNDTTFTFTDDSKNGAKSQSDQQSETSFAPAESVIEETLVTLVKEGLDLRL
jgi:flagellar hook-length control protein FliK